MTLSHNHQQRAAQHEAPPPAVRIERSFAGSLPPTVRPAVTAHSRSFNRPPRVRPGWAEAVVDLPEQPYPPRRNPQNIWLLLGIPLLTVLVMMFAFSATGSSSNAWIFAIPMGAMALIGVFGTIMNHRAQEQRQREEYHERVAFYEERLAEIQARLAALAEAERAARCAIHPDPAVLLRIAGVSRPEDTPEPRLWERRPFDDDFLDLRLGIGSVTPAFVVRAPTPPRDAQPDRRLYALQQQYATLTGVPVTLSLARLGSLGITGPGPRRDAMVRAILWQVVTFHAPSEVRLAVAAPPEAAEAWEWLRWLDHAMPLSNETNPRLRMVAGDPQATAALLSGLLDEFSRRRDRAAQSKARNEPPPIFPTVLLVVFGAERLRGQPILGEVMRSGAAHQMLLICVEERWEDLPSDCAAMIDMTAGGELRIALAGQGWDIERVIADSADLDASDALARRLAGVKLALEGGRQDLPRNKRLFDMLGIGSEADLQPPRQWRSLPEEAWRRQVPIGERAGGEPVYLNLNQTAHGPHGIIAGTTGAGKSVLLQSIIASLVITHPPERLNLLLIDFKGGASLAMFEPLAHTVGFVTDLEGRLAERAMTAIKSEIRRRKRILRETAAGAGGKVEDIHDYRMVAGQQGLPPLPNLLIVIDEFDEMVKTYGDFVTELVRVVKQGRSLGVHLLLASQQPAKAVTDEIRTQLKFFIALRLGSGEDSREMILKTDAAFLPTDIPGRAYMRVGSDTELFQVAQVVSEYREAGGAEQQPAPRVSLMVNGEERVIDPRRTAVPQETRRRTTDLDVLVRVLARAGRDHLAELERVHHWRPHPIWQPPLPAHLRLPDVQPSSAEFSEQRAGVGAVWSRQPAPERWLTATLGQIDVPQESRQEPLTVNLAEQHLAVVGASGSGKTTLLRTLLLSLALTHSPEDLWCFALDGGGQGLSILSELPHLGDVVQVRDRERVQRLFHLLSATVRERQERFRAAGASDLPAYRRGTGERLPAMLLIIDRIALLREEFSDSYGDGKIIDDLVRLLRVCKPYGVHVIITADTIRDLPYKLLSLLDRRIALRLPDLFDYADLLGGRVSGQIPTTLPGRALCTLPELGVLDCQVALPLLEPTDEADDANAEQATLLESELNDELKLIAAELASVWNGPNLRLPPRMQLLPERVPLDAVLPSGSAPETVGEALIAAIGIESDGLQPTSLTLNHNGPHALVVGPRRSGKTTTLRTLAHSLARSYSAEQLRMIIIDPHRGGLADLRRLRHVAHYARTEGEIAALLPILGQMRQPQNAGLRYVILIDDFHIGRTGMKQQFTQVYTGETNLYSVLNDLAVGGEAGVHLLIAAQIAYADDGPLKRLDEARTGMILWPHTYDTGTKLLGVSLPHGERGAELPPGRALLLQEDAQRLVQIAHAEDPGASN